MKVTIPLSGVSTASDYADGEAARLKNVRFRGSVAQSVRGQAGGNALTLSSDTLKALFSGLFPGVADASFGTCTYEEKLCYEHHATDGSTRYVTVALCTFSGGFPNKYILKAGSLTAELHFEIKSIASIGNVVILYSESEPYYILYKSGSYINLGLFPEIPVYRWQTAEKEAVVRVFGEIVNGTTDDDNRELLQKAKEALAACRRDIADEVGENQTDRFTDAFFLCAAFRLYDGTIAGFEGPVLVLPANSLRESTSVLVDIPEGQSYQHLVSAKITGFSLNVYINTTSLSSWSDIIKSIDFFITPAVGLNSEEEAVAKTTSEAGFPSLYGAYSPLVSGYTDNGIKKMKEESRYYLIKSVPVGVDYSQTPISYPSSEEDMKCLYNLVNQERLEFTTSYGATYGAERTVVYNDRVHLVGVTKKLYEGFSPELFFPALGAGTYDGRALPVSEIFGLVEVAVEVEVTMSDGSMVRRAISTPMGNSFIPISSYFCYPDANAKSVSITWYFRNSTQGEAVYKKVTNTYTLTPHDYLPIAFALGNDAFIFFSLLFRSSTFLTAFSDYPSDMVFSNLSLTVPEKRKLKVTETQNPFVMSLAGTYSFDENILAVRANTVNITESQIGQFPMYVFTENAIYALSVGSGSVAYSSVTPVLEAAVTSPVVCSIPGGILFMQKDGLYIISGKKATNITERQLEAAPLMTNDEDFDLSWSGDTTPASIPEGKNLVAIAYNHRESEIILFSGAYQYIIDPSGRLSVRQSERQESVPITHLVENATSIMSSGPGKWFSPEDESSYFSEFRYRSRPIRFGNEDYKKITRMIVRGEFSMPTYKTLYVALYSSLDGINFKCVWGQRYSSSTQELKLKDVDTGLIAVDGRYYVVEIRSSAYSQVAIRGIDFDVQPSFRKI